VSLWNSVVKLNYKTGVTHNPEGEKSYRRKSCAALAKLVTFLIGVSPQPQIYKSTGATHGPEGEKSYRRKSCAALAKLVI